MPKSLLYNDNKKETLVVWGLIGILLRPWGFPRCGCSRWYHPPCIPPPRFISTQLRQSELQVTTSYRSHISQNLIINHSRAASVFDIDDLSVHPCAQHLSYKVHQVSFEASITIILLATVSSCSITLWCQTEPPHKACRVSVCSPLRHDGRALIL